MNERKKGWGLLLILALVFAYTGEARAESGLHLEVNSDSARLLDIINKEKPVQETAHNAQVAVTATEAPDAQVSNVEPQAVPAETQGIQFKPDGLPWVRAVLSFIFVASLIILSALFVNRRMKQPKGFLGLTERPLKILQTLSIGFKRQILVLDFEGTKLLVGASGTTTQLLYAPAAPVFIQQDNLARETSKTEIKAESKKELKKELKKDAKKSAPRPSSEIKETIKETKEVKNDPADNFSEQIRLAVKSLRQFSGTNAGSSAAMPIYPAEQLLNRVNLDDQVKLSEKSTS